MKELLKNHIASITNDPEYMKILQSVQSLMKKSPVHFIHSTEECDSSLIAAICYEYRKELGEELSQFSGYYSDVSVLNSPISLESEIADEMAENIDKNEFCDLLESSINGSKYRDYLAAYIKYLPDDRIDAMLEKIAAAKKGLAKEKYWAQNAFFMLPSNHSDKMFTELFPSFKKKNDLVDLARAFGLNGVVAAYEKYYPIPDFSDDVNGKAKKQYVKEKTLLVTEAYYCGYHFEHSIWESNYLNNPYLSDLVASIVWKDSEGIFFTVVDAAPVDINGNRTEPHGDVYVGTVYDFPEDSDIGRWRSFFNQKKIKQAFPQLNEIAYRKFGSKTMTDEYHGLKISKSNIDKLIRTVNKNTCAHVDAYWNSYKGMNELHFHRIFMVEFDKDKEDQFVIKKINKHGGSTVRFNYALSMLDSFLEK